MVTHEGIWQVFLVFSLYILSLQAVLRIRDVYPGSGFRIRISDPDPGSTFFSSRIRIVSILDPGSASKKLSILTKKWFLCSRKYDPGCSSRIRILTFYPSRIPDLGVKKARIPVVGREMVARSGWRVANNERDGG